MSESENGKESRNELWSRDELRFVVTETKIVLYDNSGGLFIYLSYFRIRATNPLDVEKERLSVFSEGGA